MGKLFCPDQCCSALLLHHCTTVGRANLQRCICSGKQACCKPVSQSSTEQWGSYSALTSAAVHWCCITVQLYEEQISRGAFAVAQGCCQPVSQSSTEQWGSDFALISAAVHWYCITVQLYEGQICLGAFAVAHKHAVNLFQGFV